MPGVVSCAAAVCAADDGWRTLRACCRRGVMLRPGELRALGGLIMARVPAGFAPRG